MKRLMICSALLVAPLVANAVPGDSAVERKLLDASYAEHEYTFKREVSYDEETKRFVDQSHTDTYTVGTFLYQLPDGKCEIEHRTLDSIQEQFGVEKVNVDITRRNESCDRRID